MATISRNEYVGLFGPTDRRPHPPRRHRICSSRSSATCAARPATRSSSAAARACAKAWAWTTSSRSAGGAPDLVITNVTIIDAVLGVVKADVGIKDGRICGDRQGRQSADDGRRHARPRMRPRHRRDLRRAPDPDRRRHRHAHPLHLAAAGVRGAVQRHDDADRRRHRSVRRLQRDDGHARALEHRNDAARLRRLAGQRRHPRQGPRPRQGGAGRADRGRRGRLQDATRTGARRPPCCARR